MGDCTVHHCVNMTLRHVDKYPIHCAVDILTALSNFAALILNLTKKDVVQSVAIILKIPKHEMLP